MATYRWTGDGRFRVGATGEEVAPGETVELDEHAGDPNDELVRVEEDTAEVEDETETDEADGVPQTTESDAADGGGDADDERTPLAEMTVDDIEDAVGNVDDIETLEAMRHDEADSKDRTTAIEAIDDRIDELES